MLIDLGPLRKREFRLVFVGQGVSFLGTMVTYVAVPYQVFELTRSSFAVGLVGAAQLVPLLIFALWGGSVADALDRRRLLVASELALAVGSLTLLANALAPRPSVGVVVAVSAAMAGVNGFHRPALDALTQTLVEPPEMTAVGALATLRYGVTAIAGPALGGLLIATAGLPAAYLLDAATFGVSVLLLLRLRVPTLAHVPAPSGLASILEGLRYAVSRPELVGTYVVDLVAMTFAFPVALFPEMAQGWGGAKAAGWLYASMSIGVLGLSLTSGWTGSVRRRGAAVVLAAAAWGVAVALAGFTTSLAATVALLAIAGAADSVSGIFRSAIWNETIPNELRGRLSGVEMISYSVGPLLGNARAGWMAGLTSPRVSIAAGGLVCVAGVLLCIPLLPGFWRYRPQGSASR